jgi:Chalcone and stilbene synthases, N-terminal domain
VQNFSFVHKQLLFSLVLNTQLMEQFAEAQMSKGLANVLAIGTALPPVCVPHETYPDMYFRLTNSEHLTELKEKMTRICKSVTFNTKKKKKTGIDCFGPVKNSIKKCVLIFKHTVIAQQV